MPTLTTPSSGGTAAGAFALGWTIGSDVVGISGYQYFVSPTANFATIAKSGTVTTTTVAIANMELGNTGTFYRYVKSLDKLSNS